MTDRRNFIGTLAGVAAAAALPGAAATGDRGMMWAFLAHFGFNSWYDMPLSEAPADATPHYRTRCMADFTRFDEELWREVSAMLPGAGVNTVVVDLGEIMKFPSHPELAVKGAWEPERMQAEKKRLESMGLEVIPKLNFSAAHDSWLKGYQRMLSTRKYYEVCTDVIKDVVEVFGTPRLFHLGYDEETSWHQPPSSYKLCIVRQGDLWWHDFLKLVGTVESAGVRPWIWSDYVWAHKDEFMRRMPRSVLQSNWYYHGFTGVKPGDRCETYIKSYDWLEEGGFDQVPTGSNCDKAHPHNLAETVDYCRKVVAPERLKGFMMGSWARTWRNEEDRLKESVRLAAEARARMPQA